MQCKPKQNFVFALLKLTLNFSSIAPTLPLILSVALHLTLENYSCDHQYDVMNYYQNQKLQHFLQSLQKLHKPAPSYAIW